jgi:hypothetical protein
MCVVCARCGDDFGGVGNSSCTNISAKALAPAAGEKVRSQLRRGFCTSPTFNTFKEAAAMGNQKKEANRKEREGKTGDGMGNVKTKGENFYRYVRCPGANGRRELIDAQICKEGQGSQAPY